MANKKEWPTPACTTCGEPVTLARKWQRDQWKRVQRAYCGRVCSNAYRRKVSSTTMANTNRKYASERMKRNNPMHRPEVREKLRRSLKRIGHKPPVQGGNGRGPTVPQLQMHEALGSGWVMEHAVPTRQPKGSGYPTCYKLDLAHVDRKVAIEVDGASHGALTRQAQDAKKTRFLESMGWTVHRISNGDVLSKSERFQSLLMSTTSV